MKAGVWVWVWVGTTHTTASVMVRREKKEVFIKALEQKGEMEVDTNINTYVYSQS